MPIVSEFKELEEAWLRAVQRRDLQLLDRILDQSFVCTPWRSGRELMLRGEYLHEVERAQFRSCCVDVTNIQALDSFAIVKCRLDCEYLLESDAVNVSFCVTDVWVKKGEEWKALNRHSSLATESVVDCNTHK